MRFTYMLAPLEDTSDNALREICYNHGADLTFTEMIRLGGLLNKSESAMRKAAILNEVPTQIQLALQKEEDLSKFLAEFVPHNRFAGFNLNLGCPNPKVVGAGLGCAMMKRVSKVGRLVGMIKAAGHPCSVKMRLGLNSIEKSKKAYLNLIEGVDADFFVVHARHGGESYDAPADDHIYHECVATGKNIIANGDIDSREKAGALKKMGVKGVMIGRAAVRNPGIFDVMKGKDAAAPAALLKEYEALSTKYHTTKFDEKYKENVLKRLGKEKDDFVAASSNRHVMG